MPVVPRYNRDPVQQAALPNIRPGVDAPIEAFGGGHANQQVFSQVTAIAQKAKNDADQLAVLDADRKLSEVETRLLYDPQSGAINKKGKDAFGAHEEVMRNLETEVQSIEGELRNETQRMAFRRSLVSRQVNIDRQLQRHVSTEIQRYDNETTESYLANERDAAVANYHDPERVNLSVERQRAAIQDHANRNGLPPEWVENKLKDSTSKTHGSVISRMLANGQDLDAKKYYDAHKDLFTGADAAAIEKDLEEGSLRGESQRQSDLIFEKFGSSMSTAMDKAREIEDPKLRDEVTSRLKDRFQMREVERRQSVENLHKSATDIIDRTGNIDEIPTDQWKQFSLSERSALKNYARARREGIEPETKWDLYYDLKTQASTPALRSKFLQTNLYEHRPDFANAEFKELVNLQTSLRSGDDKAAKDLDGFRTDQMIVNDALRAAGFDTSPKPGKKDAEAVNKFRRAVDEHLKQLQSRTGRKATNQEVQEIVDNLMVKGVTEKGLIWDTTKRLFELGPQDQFEIDPDDIPAGERAKIEEALRRRGIAVNNQKIVDLYTRKLSGMVKRGP